MQMTYPKRWGADALFAYAGASPAKRLNGRLCGGRIGIWFDTNPRCTLYFPFENILKSEFDFVLSDRIKGSAVTAHGTVDFEFRAVSPYCIAVKAAGQADLRLSFDGGVVSERNDNSIIYSAENSTFRLSSEDGMWFFSYGREIADSDEKILASDGDENLSAACPSDRFSEKYLDLYSKCVSVVKSSVLPTSSGYCFGSAGEDGLCINSLDAMLCAVGLRRIFGQISKSTLKYLAECVREDGVLPCSIGGRFDSLAAVPLLPWAFKMVFGDDKKTLEKYYDVLKSTVMYYVNTRDIAKNNLYQWHGGGSGNVGAESGMYNSPRFDKNVITDGADLSAYMYMSVSAMRFFAESISRNADILYWGVLAERINHAANDYLYDEKANFYFDREIIGKRAVPAKTTAGFMPIFAGLCPLRRQKPLENLIFDKSEFLSPCGVLSAERCPGFSSDFYRGAVIPMENFKIAFGLMSQGRNDSADRILYLFLEAVRRGLETDGVVYQYYSPVPAEGGRFLTKNGFGGGTMSLYGYGTCVRDCPVSASAVLAMLDMAVNGI